MTERRMEQDKKMANVLPMRSPSARGTLMQSVQKTASLTSVADAWFDLFLGERAGKRTDQGLDLPAFLPSGGASRLLGILGRCQISGCDVHLLTVEQDILRHLERGAAAPPGFSDARDYLQSPHESAIAVVVYSDHADVLHVDGSVTPLVTP